MYILTLRVCPYLNIGHHDEVHSSSLSVLSSAAVQGLRDWGYPFGHEFTQDMVLLINLCQRQLQYYHLYNIPNSSYIAYFITLTVHKLAYTLGILIIQYISRDHNHAIHMHGSFSHCTRDHLLQVY